uniref:Uncharacterized protein n=1 Tax=Arundo donax TaxID=35708 RepID=A0A0A9CXV1_ARUDO
MRVVVKRPCKFIDFCTSIKIRIILCHQFTVHIFSCMRPKHLLNK